MLRLKNIVKNYNVASGEIKVLKGLNVAFRKNEFVSILGPSGCGKTTTLNIVGGLDKYTSGDLIIAGKSTKNFTDRDWDNYRNERIGFVFQSYNLIPHQTVLGNVELSLTISGIGKEERTRRALSALEKVGLKGEENKRPNQLSGGQCQRVAIARALVNEPDILLADEPTGALDSKTSVQIMELIKEISKEKLVIMVTHNAEIAEDYSTRIIRLVDGEITEDTNPFSEEDEINEVAESSNPVRTAKKRKAKMSWWTAFKLSLRNLFTKKGRTILTSFAGSIGIIGISLILAVSQGTTAYINSVQESTLSSYPITLEQTSVDLSALMESFMGKDEGESNKHDLDAIYKDMIMVDLVNTMSKVEASENDLKSFKTYLEDGIKDENSNLYSAVSGVQYTYDFDFEVYTRIDENGDIIKSDAADILREKVTKYMLARGEDFGMQEPSGAETTSSMFTSMMTGTGIWQEMLPAKDGGVINDLIYSQYDKIYGEWPTAYNEVLLVVNERNEIDDLTLYALGLITEEEIDKMLDDAIAGKEIENDGKSWSYKDVCDREFKTIMAYDRYQDLWDTGVFTDVSTNKMLLEKLYQDADSLKVTGIIRPNPNSDNHMLSGSIAYTYKLTEHVLKKALESDVVKAQLANINTDVLTGLPFKSSTENLTDEEKDKAFREYIENIGNNEEKRAEIFIAMNCVMPKELLDSSVENMLASFKKPDGTLNRDMLIATISNILKEQMGSQVGDIGEYFADMSDKDLLGLITPFAEDMVKKAYADNVKKAFDGKSATELSMALEFALKSGGENACAVYYDEVMTFSDNAYDENLVKLGYAEIDSPSAINIYAASFKDKDVIVAAIDDYNLGKEETEQIKYTDYMGIMMSSITTIIDAITYVLIAFVAISLVVSSIMISVIVLISVQERTKEIGILRSIGASKRDVSNLFNAETVIIGFASGLLGVVVTFLLCIPINIILQALTGLATLRAILPLDAAIILIAISVVLNLFAGLIPSRSAAKKDPVVALRTE